MSVQSEIDRINGNVANTYSALSEMGATMPEQQNSDNMAATVLTVPKGGSKTVQSDWNQTDESAADFIKNKPFGDSVVTIFEEQTLVIEDMHISLLSEIKDGANVTVELDGVPYSATALDTGGVVAVGNISIVNPDVDDTGEPFIILAFGRDADVFVVAESESVTLKIEANEPTKLDKKYYETCSVFYTNYYDSYLYKEIECVTKATASELLFANNKGLISIGTGSVYMPVVCLESTDEGLIATAIRYFDRATNTPTYVQYYTSEITG